ncbi:unnamed protein product [Effrenium voratum]|nr:unnamed protein product [Effrenium voratum]
MPKIRAAQTALVEQSNAVRALLAPGGAALKEKNKEKEEKDLKEFEEGLPAAKDLTSLAEESVVAIVTMAEPIMSNPPPEGSEDLKKALDEVETTATDAQNKITEARKTITQKLATARSYAIETRKTAIAEYGALQAKLTESQKKLMPFRTFKRDFQAKVKAKQALGELADKLSAAELEVEKAAMMSIAAESGQMSEEEIAACQKVAEPAQAAVMAAVKDVDLKLKTAQAAVKEELSALKDRGMELKKKCETVVSTMKVQKQGISAQTMAATITEKVAAAEEALGLCQDAEMPFLKGIEVLPPEESAQAIGDCEASAAKADAALNQARTLVRTKQAEVKQKFPKDLQEKTLNQLSQLGLRVENCGKKIADFKKETAERKLNALLAEVVEAITAAEQKVKAHAEVAKVFSEDLNTVTEESIKEAMEKVGDLEKEATASLAEARKLMTAKQKDAKGPAASGAMQKLQGRVKTSMDELGKNRKASTYGDKLIKGKEALAEEMVNVDKAESEVAKVEKLAVPVEAVETPTDEECAELGDAIVSAQNSIKSTTKSVEANLSVPVPALKLAFNKVAERTKKVQERLDKVLAGKKGLRERSLGEAYVREGKKKTDHVDSLVEKVNDAELPFLKGIEVLPLTEAASTIECSEKAAGELQLGITEARNFLAAKSVELRAFSDKEKSKPLLEELTSLTSRINSAAQKHASFKKDTDARKKNASLQEAQERLAKLQQEVDKVTESVTPLDDEEVAEKLGNDEAKAICEKVSEQAKAAQESLDQVRHFLTARQKENQGNAQNTETVKGLQGKLAAANTALTKAKKIVSTREGAFVAKELMAEVEQMMSSLDTEVKAVETACAPLLEGGEEFLVAASLKTLAAAWRAHMTEKSLDIDGLFKAIGGGNAVPEADFLAYLEKLPEAIDHPEVEFSEEIGERGKGKGWGKRRDDAGRENGRDGPMVET